MARTRTATRATEAPPVAPETDDASEQATDDATTEATAAVASATATPRRRGRPPGSKNRKPAAGAASASANGTAAETATPRRRGRPPGRKTTSRPEAESAGEASAAATPASTTPRRRGRPPGRRTGTAPTSVTPRPSREPLTVEQIAAVESPREFRLNPRGTSVAYTAEAAGARQLFTLQLRNGYPVQITASEKGVTDPQWSPDGRRLAFVRGDAIWVVDVDGTRLTQVSGHPAGTSLPRWSPDGRSLAFVSRRRGWAQVWVVDAPIPRRGRPATNPKPPEPRVVTRAGFDVELYEWAPDSGRIAVTGQGPDATYTSDILVVDLETGREQAVGGGRSWDTAAHWMPDGSLLHATDASGWFQIVRRAPDGRQTVLTTGEREHAEPSGAYGFVPLPSPDGSRLTHPEFHDGLVDLVVAPIAGEVVKRGRGRPPKNPPPMESAGEGRVVNPWPGVWRGIGWLPDGASVAAVGESDARPQDLWLLPVPGVAADGARPRQVTESMPAVVAQAFAPGRAIPAERIAFTARDGLRIEGTLWRPVGATGRRGGDRVPTVVYPHGGPTSQSLRSWIPFKQLLVREGFAFLDVDFRGSTGYGRTFRQANRDEWGNADARDMVDAARWAAEQPWSDGRLAIYGGSYGGYLTLAALVEEPSVWRAGVDLYGDSDIAESYRHGDRLGRLDLHRMMGSPDDPARLELYRRGSPLYRAERIEAPLLLLHGRKDKRVVPLMTEKMVEALEIEGKHHEVHWYDEEAHGWERRETKRDAWARILAFLKRHVMDETPKA
ncbi:MAG: S9 family peptidase [Chloroflexota bacterium]